MGCLLQIGGYLALCAAIEFHCCFCAILPDAGRRAWRSAAKAVPTHLPFRRWDPGTIGLFGLSFGFVRS